VIQQSLKGAPISCLTSVQIVSELSLMRDFNEIFLKKHKFLKMRDGFWVVLVVNRLLIRGKFIENFMFLLASSAVHR
jgi:hypothetical protein